MKIGSVISLEVNGHQPVDEPDPDVGERGEEPSDFSPRKVSMEGLAVRMCDAEEASEPPDGVSAGDAPDQAPTCDQNPEDLTEDEIGSVDVFEDFGADDELEDSGAERERLRCSTYRKASPPRKPSQIPKTEVESDWAVELSRYEACSAAQIKSCDRRKIPKTASPAGVK